MTDGQSVVNNQTLTGKKIFLFGPALSRKDFQGGLGPWASYIGNRWKSEPSIKGSGVQQGTRFCEITGEYDQ